MRLFLLRSARRACYSESAMKNPASTMTPEQARTEFLALYEMLKRIEPDVQEHDIIWPVLYYIDAKKRWIPVRFTLHRAKVYGSLEFPEGMALLEVKVPEGNVEFVEVNQSGYLSGTKLWPNALVQLRRTLEEAVVDLDAFNDKIERELPLEWRFGKIKRRLTWRPNADSISEEKIVEVRGAVTSAANRTSLPGVTVNDYIRLAAVALTAGFHETLPPEEIHRRHADSRHGGMLDLPRDDADAFRAWFESLRWQGAHPFEIVYGTPHGVTLWPKFDEQGVRFILSVSDEFYEKPSLDMVIALDRAGVPFQFNGLERIVKKLSGNDLIDVAPFRRPGIGYDVRVRLETLRNERPDAVDKIVWDKLQKWQQMTAESLKKVAEFEAYQG